LRRREGFQLPRVVVFIEDLATALENGRRPFKEALLRLLEDGGRAGIHIVAATERPQAPTLDTLLKNGLPVRICGRLTNEGEAWAATGITQSGAEQLLGRGDFVAVVTGNVVRFQAAYIGDYDLHLCVDSLHRDRPPTIIAQPWDGRPRLASGLQNAAGTFYFDGRNVNLAPNE
jgi:S-DNA-T family DNA segregation ATPase FtsK/SpoIIIE